MIKRIICAMLVAIVAAGINRCKSSQEVSPRAATMLMPGQDDQLPLVSLSITLDACGILRVGRPEPFAELPVRMGVAKSFAQVGGTVCVTGNALASRDHRHFMIRRDAGMVVATELLHLVSHPSARVISTQERLILLSDSEVYDLSDRGVLSNRRLLDPIVPSRRAVSTGQRIVYVDGLELHTIVAEGAIATVPRLVSTSPRAWCVDSALIVERDPARKPLIFQNATADEVSRVLAFVRKDHSIVGSVKLGGELFIIHSMEFPIAGLMFTNVRTHSTTYVMNVICSEPVFVTTELP